ncbi:DUF1801 domain-containing protein [Gracilibacillus caseinilyticus]|uniref:DUF1801 domain-containing protein n=1 Tax=Gracilibacillus caseinilyticus TaxID=2932256 RepID=A0ABY4EZ69_9BACI|nr:DUF1801 domain-containing protein [Gracilibacillus caseinilyticus]UOQ49306.1 DUF1801 domain-containing protein [Gracilibacillus caseinilyticus]
MSDMISEYLADKDEKWHQPFLKLYQTIDEHIPNGFAFQLQYGMPSYVVPLSTFPDGYHCEKDTPLPFLSIAAQKRHIAVYHMGIYADDDLLSWFEAEYPKHMSTKLNMGKSCIRFTNPKKIPYELLGELASKVTVEGWINRYTTSIR